jgi:hypothetical protein
MSEKIKEDRLREIAKYILFVRQKTFRPEQFQHQFELAMINEELSQLEISEINHLEEEFEGYENRYPKE